MVWPPVLFSRTIRRTRGLFSFMPLWRAVRTYLPTLLRHAHTPVFQVAWTCRRA